MNKKKNKKENYDIPLESNTSEPQALFSPMSVAELNKRIDKSENDFKNGRYKSNVELINKYKYNELRVEPGQLFHNSTRSGLCECEYLLLSPDRFASSGVIQI